MKNMSRKKTAQNQTDRSWEEPVLESSDQKDYFPSLYEDGDSSNKEVMVPLKEKENAPREPVLKTQEEEELLSFNYRAIVHGIIMSEIIQPPKAKRPLKYINKI